MERGGGGGPGVDVELFERWMSRWRRHAGLRSRGTRTRGAPVRADGRRLRAGRGGAGRRAARVDRMLTEQAAQPFDLEHGPLVRARVLRVDGGDDHVCWSCVHPARGWRPVARAL